jgi:hypothetical protein
VWPSSRARVLVYDSEICYRLPLKSACSLLVVTSERLVVPGAAAAHSVFWRRVSARAASVCSTLEGRCGTSGAVRDHWRQNGPSEKQLCSGQLYHSRLQQAAHLFKEAGDGKSSRTWACTTARSRWPASRPCRARSRPFCARRSGRSRPMMCSQPPTRTVYLAIGDTLQAITLLGENGWMDYLDWTSLEQSKRNIQLRVEA